MKRRAMSDSSLLRRPPATVAVGPCKPNLFHSIIPVIALHQRDVKGLPCLVDRHEVVSLLDAGGERKSSSRLRSI